MLLNIRNLPETSEHPFDEIVIANFGAIQIAVSTTKRMVQRQIAATRLSVPQRHYHSQGWLICDRQIIAVAEAFEIGTVSPTAVSTRLIKRLDPGIPLSFEAKGAHPFPHKAITAATFAYEFQDEEFPYHAMFHHISPRFVRIYPLRPMKRLIHQVDQFLAEEAAFIDQNYQHLKQIPFYQQRFNL